MAWIRVRGRVRVGGDLLHTHMHACKAGLSGMRFNEVRVGIRVRVGFGVRVRVGVRVRPGGLGLGGLSPASDDDPSTSRIADACATVYFASPLTNSEGTS